MLVTDTKMNGGCPEHTVLRKDVEKVSHDACCAGYRVGRQLAERYTFERPRLGENLDVIKFICKEFWNEAFRKQVLL